MYQKRNNIPRIWPLPRKGSKFVIAPNHNRTGFPLLLALRDILKLGKTKKEIRKILRAGNIIVNGEIRKDEKFPVFPLDCIKIGNKNYEVGFKNKKIWIEEGKEFKSKTRKVIGKKIIGKNIIQINMLFGDNVLTKEKVKINDSIVLDSEGKIIKILRLEEKAKAIILSGKHMGKEGIIEKIEGDKLTLETKEGKINANIKDIIVI